MSGSAEDKNERSITRHLRDCNYKWLDAIVLLERRYTGLLEGCSSTVRGSRMLYTTTEPENPDDSGITPQ